MGNKVISTTEQLVKPILDDMNLELVDVEFIKEGSNWFLRIYIDSDNGVDIEECGIVSEKLSEKLDEEDPITQAYFLEVSSPGVERPLKKKKDFENSIGKRVFIKTYVSFEGEKTFEGTLQSFDGEHVTVDYKVKAKTKTITIPYDKIASARLAVSFS